MAHPNPLDELPIEPDQHYLKLTIDLAQQSVAAGNHPFEALLAGPGGEVLIASGNTFSSDGGFGHVEANVAREAARRFNPDFLQNCTLYTSVEPCCMCTRASYWAGTGAVVYGMTERRLAILTGDNPENLTLDLSCKMVFAAGQRATKVCGPFEELEEEIVSQHKDFW